MSNPNEKYEIIEKALQESVGGGALPVCHITCHIFSINVCDINFCSIPYVTKAK